jgi:hypothetical protein
LKRGCSNSCADILPKRRRASQRDRLIDARNSTSRHAARLWFVVVHEAIQLVGALLNLSWKRGKPAISWLRNDGARRCLMYNGSLWRRWRNGRAILARHPPHCFLSRINLAAISELWPNGDELILH